MVDVEQARKTGGMIALIPSDDDARRLLADKPNAESLDDLHVTMIYLGEDVTDWGHDRRTWVTKAAQRAADSLNGSVRARAFAHATFNPDGGPDGDRDPCAVYLIGDVEHLAHVRQSLKGQIEAALDDDFPKQHEPYVPHLTAGYGLTAADLDYVGSVTFDRIEVHLGTDHTVIPLQEKAGRTTDERLAASAKLPGRGKPRPVASMRDVPGWEGSAGPVTREAYGKPHVYARDVHSGAGNCVCGMGDEDDIHVPVPKSPRGTWRQKDVYATMAPMSYTRGLGASPARPRQSGPPVIEARRHAPTLRGQVARVRRRKRRDDRKTLAACRGRLEVKSDPYAGLDEDGMAILRVAAGWDEPARDLSGLKAAWDRLDVKARGVSDGTERCMGCGADIDREYETVDGKRFGYPGVEAVVCLGCGEGDGYSEKGAPSRMPPQLMQYWAYGKGRQRWANSPTPYRTLRGLLRRYGVGGMSINGATANVMRAATGIYPGQRPNGGRKSLMQATRRLLEE